MTGAPSARRDFLAGHLGPVLPLLALLLAMEWSPVDSAVSSWFFDAASRAFPLRYSVPLELLGHQWPKHLVVVLACGVIALYGLSFTLPQLKPRRRLLLFLSLAMTLAPLAVVLLKAGSARHCPWSLQEFGGYARHLSLFDAAPPGLAPGHCFPGGHASAGFCLFAFYFAGYSLRNRALRGAGLWGGLASGMGLGMVRVAQGAHFLSHNLWSGIVVWLVMASIYVALMDGEQGCLTPAAADPQPAGLPGPPSSSARD